MAAHPLLPNPAVLTLDSLSMRNGVIVVAARAVTAGAPCPGCSHPSQRVHSRYPRTLLDLPWQGNAVRIALNVRKFFCDNQECERRIFAERLPAVATRYARKTCRLAEALRELAYLAGGEAAARIARAFGLLISPDALLDGLKKAPPLSLPTPRVLGVDDFAFKKGRRYGTILVDLERNCPVDLLPDREFTTLARWLQEHPGVQTVTRDRSSEYAKGIQEGAPDAVQVADRFHLLVNLRDMLRRVTDRYRAALKGIEIPRLAQEQVARPRRPERNGPAEATSATRHQERLEHHQQIHALLGEGLPKRAIARKLSLSPMTVYKYLRLEPAGLIRRSHCSSSQLDPFMPYLCQRWEDGCHNATQLWREIKERGYPGTARMVLVWAHQQRQTPAPSTPNRYRTGSAQGPEQCGKPLDGRAIDRTSSSRQFSWFLLKPSSVLNLTEQAVWERIRLACPELVAVREIAQQFQAKVRGECASSLDGWLRAASETREPALVQLAAGLAREKPSIVAALSLPWSNGQTEGQVNRLKFLKRQMYGRAGFDLLRARVLYRAESLAS